jgi:transposase
LLGAIDVAEAKRLRTAGQSYREIGRRYGVSGPTISKLIGSTVRITPIQRQLIHLHCRALSYDSIAARLSKPEGTVAVMLARLVRKGLLPARSTSPPLVTGVQRSVWATAAPPKKSEIFSEILNGALIYMRGGQHHVYHPTSE